jgi:hypothetical protein
MTVGAHFPPNARAVRAELAVRFTGVAGNVMSIDAIASTNHPGSPTTVADVRIARGTYTFNAGGIVDLSFTAEFGRIPNAAAVGTFFTVQVDWNQAGTLTKANEALKVIGWKMTG